MAKITLFAQIIQKIPRDIVKHIVKEYDTDKHAKGFNSWSHLVSMVFCQFVNCVSLREISNGLKSATGNLNHLGITRAQLYKSRWMIEIFFRNLKQNLHIKSFVGTSRNAVEIQIWTALITMLLMSYLRQTAKYDWHFSNLVSSLRLNTFTKIDLQKWLDEPFSPPPDESEHDVGVSALFEPAVQPSN